MSYASSARRPASAARLARAGLAALGLALGAGACLDRPVSSVAPRTSNAIIDELANDKIKRIDLLFMIDNSISMADKQAILAEAVPDLLNRFITPNCVQADGRSVPPNATTGKCDSGTPEFDPVGDIHIGVVSSSLGSHGGNVCPPEANAYQNDGGLLLSRSGAPGPDEPAVPPVPTYKGLGFLAWDQGDPDDPDDPNDPDAISDPATLTANFTNIVKGVGQTGCGLESSLESWYRFLVDPSPPVLEPPPLVDPADPKQGRKSVPPAPKEVDQLVLRERADFLRPDSLVAVIALSDENDCSFVEGYYPPRARGDSGLVEELPEAYRKHIVINKGSGAPVLAVNGYEFNDNVDGLLEAGTAACAADPYSPYCFNCGFLGNDNVARRAAGCPDYEMAPGLGRRRYDRVNQRCFDQRKRFGFEALHPVQRYIDGLTQRRIYDTSGAIVALNKAAPGDNDVRYFADDNPSNRDPLNLVAPKVDNPLFVDLPWRRYLATCRDANDPGTCDASLKPPGRDRELPGRLDGRVYFAAIVGVPWQDIALDPATLAPSGASPGGFKAPGDIDWPLILGDPGALMPPKDPLMRESIEPRFSNAAPLQHPVTQRPLNDAWNGINGHEWDSVIRDDLQYACIFPLAADVDCANTPPNRYCDCETRLDDANPPAPIPPEVRRSPLCESYAPGDAAKAGTGAFTAKQARAKAYPGLRFLEVLKGIGEGAIAASICPETQDRAQPHYGYRPAVNTIIDRLKNALKGRCLPRRLDVQGARAPCLIIEAKYQRLPDGSQPATQAELDACRACNAPGYAPLSPELLATLQGQDVAEYDCLCEFQQLQPAAGLETCQTDPRDPAALANEDGLHGWCYVDPAFAADSQTRQNQEKIVAACPANEKRTLRFIGRQDEASSIFITCLGAASNSSGNQSSAGAGGASGVAGAPLARQCARASRQARKLPSPTGGIALPFHTLAPLAVVCEGGKGCEVALTLVGPSD